MYYSFFRGLSSWLILYACTLCQCSPSRRYPFNRYTASGCWLQMSERKKSSRPSVATASGSPMLRQMHERCKFLRMQIAQEVCKCSEHVFVFEPFQQRFCSLPLFPLFPTPKCNSVAGLPHSICSLTLVLAHRKRSPLRRWSERAQEYLHILDISSHCIGTILPWVFYRPPHVLYTLLRASGWDRILPIGGCEPLIRISFELPVRIDR